MTAAPKDSASQVMLDAAVIAGAAHGSAFKAGDRVRLKTPRASNNRNPNCKETATVIWATEKSIAVQFDGSKQKKRQSSKYHPSYFVLLESDTPNNDSTTGNR